MAFTSAAKISNRSLKTGPFTAAGTATWILATGCRTGRLRASRAARASEARRRTAAIAASRSGARRPLSAGNGARCTEVPVSARCIQSARNGAAGASIRAEATRVSCSVSRATGSVARSGAQKRGRLRRTYHRDRSSPTKSMMARTPAVTS